MRITTKEAMSRQGRFGTMVRFKLFLISPLSWHAYFCFFFVMKHYQKLSHPPNDNLIILFHQNVSRKKKQQKCCPLTMASMWYLLAAITLSSQLKGVE